MKTLHLYIIACLFAIALFPFNTILAQNEIQPKIWFDHASYATKRMNCNPYSAGIISEQGPDYSKATIIVTDPSANKYSTAIDRIAVHVWSDSDQKGIEITAYETEVNSGIFNGTVTINDGQSTQGTIHVNDGDTLSARYSGTTPWSVVPRDHGITTTAFIGALCPPLERVPASAIQVTDNKGNEQKTILADKQIQIKSNLTNVTIRNQTFAYIVQVQDKDGTIESLSWVSGLLIPSQIFSPSVSWTPSKAGNYTVQVFVWQSLNNPNSLSPPVSTDLTVWPSLSAYTKSTIKNAENFQCRSGYELVIKSNNNSTACVTPQTAQKLVERGWAKQAGTGIQEQRSEKLQVLTQPSNETLPPCASKINHQTVFAGYAGELSCPALPFTMASKMLNYTGFYGVYREINSSALVTANTYFSNPLQEQLDKSGNDRSEGNFVLQPGHNGTITYEITGYSGRCIGNCPPNLTYPTQENLTNTATFYNHVNAEMIYSHPGLFVFYYPTDVIVKDNSTEIVKATISASSDTPRGTYWVILEPGNCDGGPLVLLTVSDCEK